MKNTNRTWNHRVVRRVYPEAHSDEQVFFQIHEAHYEGERVTAITTEPVSLMELSLDELRATLERMLRALDAPVLDYQTRQELVTCRHPSRTPKLPVGSSSSDVGA